MPVVLRLFPNGEFTHGISEPSRDRAPKQSTSEESYLLSVAETVERAALEHPEILGADFGSPGTIWHHPNGAKYEILWRENTKTAYYIEYPSGVSRVKVIPQNFSLTYLADGGGPLGFSVAPIFVNEVRQSSPRAPKGSRGMSSNLARNIRNAGYYLEQKYSRCNLSFLTLTLPRLNPGEYRMVSEGWGNLVDRFVEWLGRRIYNQKGILEYVYCTEIQSKRLADYGDCALHLHLLFPGRKSRNAAWEVRPIEVRRKWLALVSDCVDRRVESDACENLQQVKRSASSYLAKYLSKGCVKSPGGESKQDISPVAIHWGGMARKVSRWIKKKTKRYTGGTSQDLLYLFLKVAPLLSQSGIIFYGRKFITTRPANDPSRDSGFWVGWGRIKDKRALGADDPLAYLYLEYRIA